MVFDLSQRQQELADLEKATESPEFWGDPDSAQKHMQRLTAARAKIEPWVELREKVEDLATLAELGVEESDDSVEAEISRGLSEARETLQRLELSAMLSGKYDDANAIMMITAGAGGTEACDWAAMLLDMYRFWAQRHGYDFQVLSFVEGDQAGYRNVTARVEGLQAYGYLRAETGVHRLVRISPFDASKRRHTSFASVDVAPEIPEDEEVEIDPADLRIDTYRSSGAGGQHVNKTDSAVRITHIPTGIVVQCQNERSQHANRRSAMNVLRARLYEEEQRRRQEEVAALRGERKGIDFGSQIRSYVLQPYRMVKDHRTDVEAGDVDAVLHGDLDQFIRPYLLQFAGQRGEEQ
ncbi:MAG: peptide chain release factor 2 [Armatimonadetes bacterium]|nr:peptide chain release factor 2 [Armatimonadota bacterium]